MVVHVSAVCNVVVLGLFIVICFSLVVAEFWSNEDISGGCLVFEWLLLVKYWLNLPGAGTRVITDALAPGRGSPLHSGGLKPATIPNRARSGA